MLRMKIIFLDVDGVLNHHECFRNADTCRVVDRACIERVNAIHARTGAQVCLSSTWRMWSESFQFLKDHGLTVPIVDKTPTLRNRTRGDEIREWMNPTLVEDQMGRLLEKPPFEIESFVIIDDDTDFDAELTEKHLVRTSAEDGLQDHHVDLAVGILDRKA